MGLKSCENPLIGHTRMRALYRALVELRAVDRTEPAACLVGTAIGLAEDDLAIGSQETAVLEHIRAVGRRTTGGAVTPAAWQRLVTQLGSTQNLSFSGDAFERAVFAAGAAFGLKASGGQGVAVAYVETETLSARAWRRLFAAMARPGLPLVVVALPGASARHDLEALAQSEERGAENAVPVIPVDAGDPLAIYRVAQECLLRARAGGGAAAIACVPCGTDPVALLARQLVRKGICTEQWIRGVDTHLTGLIDAR
jgi:hypothetical protein